MLFCRLLIFFQNQLFWNILSGIYDQRVKHSVGPDQFQTVCKSYQQTTLIGKELNLITFVFKGYHYIHK